MKKTLFALIFALLVFVPCSFAGVTDNSETLTVLTNGTSSFTTAKIQDPSKSPQGAFIAFCTVTAGSINFTYDGTTPTTGATGVGHQISSGGWFKLTGHARLLNFLAIGTTQSSTVYCTYSFSND